MAKGRPKVVGNQKKDIIVRQSSNTPTYDTLSEDDKKMVQLRSRGFSYGQIEAELGGDYTIDAIKRKFIDKVYDTALSECVEESEYESMIRVRAMKVETMHRLMDIINTTTDVKNATRAIDLFNKATGRYVEVKHNVTRELIMGEVLDAQALSDEELAEEKRRLLAQLESPDNNKEGE